MIVSMETIVGQKLVNSWSIVKQPTVIKQSSVVNYLMQSVTSSMLLILFYN